MSAVAKIVWIAGLAAVVGLIFSTGVAPVEGAFEAAGFGVQLALAWLLLQPFDIVPIPGTKRAVYVEENLAATNVALSPDEIAYISSLFAPERIVGQRYAPVHAAHVANKK